MDAVEDRRIQTRSATTTTTIVGITTMVAITMGVEVDVEDSRIKIRNEITTTVGEITTTHCRSSRISSRHHKPLRVHVESREMTTKCP